MLSFLVGSWRLAPTIEYSEYARGTSRSESVVLEKEGWEIDTGFREICLFFKMGLQGIWNGNSNFLSNYLGG